MYYVLWTIAVLVVLCVVQQLVWRYASRRWSLPCPSYLSWMVDGSVVDAIAGTEKTLARMDLRPGMTVVEIGPGTGRLLLRAARRVLPGGKAIGVELQQGMIDKLQNKLARDDPGNVEIVHADATKAVLPRESADLVYMCTVLGEIPDRATALKNCYDTLRPGGRLSITEIIMDPHYVKRATLEALTHSAGFEPEDYSSTWRMYTANFCKPTHS